MPKAILFDFDGTLANTAQGIVLTMQRTFEEMKQPIPSEEAIRKTIGLPLQECVRILGDFDDRVAAAGAAVYRCLFLIYEINNISIYPEVPETLAKLAKRGIRMAICTSRNKFSLDRILQRHNLEQYFETIITADTPLVRPKPAPDMALVLLTHMGLQAAETWVVGDTTFDIEMGNSAHCTTVAVTYGNHTRQQLLTSHPTHLIDHFGKLLTLRNG